MQLGKPTEKKERKNTPMHTFEFAITCTYSGYIHITTFHDTNQVVRTPLQFFYNVLNYKNIERKRQLVVGGRKTASFN